MSSAPGKRGIAFNDDDFDCVDDAVVILLLIGGERTRQLHDSMHKC